MGKTTEQPEQASAETLKKHRMNKQVIFTDIEGGTRSLFATTRVFWTERCA